MKQLGKIIFLGLCCVTIVGCGKNKEAENGKSEPPKTSKVVKKKKEQPKKDESKEEIKEETKESVNNNAPEEKRKVNLTEDEKRLINDEFVQWAIERAEIGNMALVDIYFRHGAGGRGDYYARSVDGDIQVQNQNNPGEAAFPIHSLGGCVFYTSLDGTIGWDERANNGSIADSYYLNLDRSKPHSVYLLGDNGVVYEKKAANQEEDKYAYGEYSDEGVRSNVPEGIFLVSEDQDAQAKLRELIEKYAR